MINPTIDQRALQAAQQVLLAAIGQSQKAAPGVPNAGYLYVPGGSLTYPGSSRDIINAFIMPSSGLAGRLARRKSTETNPILDILTGLTASSGTNPTLACADGRQPGNLKFCKRSHPFGRIPMDSQVAQIDKMGTALNRGVFRDRTLVGDPFGGGRYPQPLDFRTALQNEYKTKILELFAAFNRDYARLIYSGNYANTAGSEGYIEFYGLDTLINTGLRDAVTGIACPAADSIVVDFSNQNITTGGANASGGVVNYITYILRNLRDVTQRTGLGDTWNGVLAMRRDLFYEITRVWPCANARAIVIRCRAFSTNPSAPAWLAC